MPEIVVAVRIPLTEDPSPPAGEYPFPWIATVGDFLEEVEQEEIGQEEIDGEEISRTTSSSSAAQGKTNC